MEPFYKDGLKFECKRCSYCCGNSPGFVYLSRRDLLTLCEWFEMTVKEFADEYCRLVNYYYGATVVALKEQKNYDCILWNKGCTAYKARPIQCSTYPFWSWMVKDKARWEECAQGCPGMNNGKLYSMEEIENSANLYESNKPLTKEELEEMIQAQA